MAKTAKERRANALYNKRTYERLYYEVRRDAEINGTVIRKHAAAQGESMNGFIRRAIREAIERDNEKE